MERKVGEIFTYEDKIYKALKATDGCKGCAFRIQLGTCNKMKNCFASYREDKTSVIFKEIKTMEIKNNQLTIDIPKGMEIDAENSDLTKGVIKFKPKCITYDDIEKTLHLKETCTSITLDSGNIDKLSAINELVNIAKYYNKNWKPNWDNFREKKYFIKSDNYVGEFFVGYDFTINLGGIYFKNEEDAQSVIGNPNFKEILNTIYKY